MDDVEFYTDSEGNDVVTKYGVTSNVAATSASINTDKNSPAYNPEHSGTRKTYKKFIRSSNGKEEEITESGSVGLPYTWKRLDSLNVDFRPEVSLSGIWLSENWDISLRDFSNVNFSNKDWYTTAGIGDTTIRTLRIHSSINFDGAYQVRPEQDSPDVLWMRIESEPMLYHPDVVTESDTAHLNIKSLNSVNQIILNFNFSNEDEKYRPIIIFYDGPESYKTNEYIRASKPVIMNFKVPFRGVLYAPNSPVIIIGDAKDSFKGFVVAKKYMRLMDDDDFESGGYRYFNNLARQYEYNRTIENGKVVYRDFNGKISGIVTSDEKAYKLEYFYAKNDTEKNTRYYKVTNENGIEMFVDDYGDIAVEDLLNPPTKCGEYDNFGRTEFTTHKYNVLSSSKNNMLLSGK